MAAVVAAAAPSQAVLMAGAAAPSQAVLMAATNQQQQQQHSMVAAMAAAAPNNHALLMAAAAATNQQQQQYQQFQQQNQKRRPSWLDDDSEGYSDEELSAAAASLRGHGRQIVKTNGANVAAVGLGNMATGINGGSDPSVYHPNHLLLNPASAMGSGNYNGTNTNFLAQPNSNIGSISGAANMVGFGGSNGGGSLGFGGSNFGGRIGGDVLEENDDYYGEGEDSSSSGGGISKGIEMSDEPPVEFIPSQLLVNSVSAQIDVSPSKDYKVDLFLVCRNFGNVIYRSLVGKSKFPAVNLQHKNPKGNVNFFPNGKITVAGATSSESAKKLLKMMAHRFKKTLDPNIRWLRNKFTIHTIFASYTSGCPVNLHNFSRGCPWALPFNSESATGVKVDLMEGLVTCMVYASGKLKLTSKDDKALAVAVQKVLPYLSQFRQLSAHDM
eukprot:Filipodium_phascolosomae@DN6711_c0_g1_i1.p1